MTANDARSIRLRRLLRGSALAACLAATPALAQNLPVPAVPGNFGGADRNNTPTGFSIDLDDENRVINWASFNIGANRTVEFTTDANTPFAVLNRVVLNNPSTILGSLSSKANVTVWLVNPSGITFGNSGSFSGGSLVLSTATQDLADVLTGTFNTRFIAGNQSLALNNHSGAEIVLTAGTGALRGAGPIVVIAQRITANKEIAPTAGDVALIAASDVVVPSALGSPLGIAITRGTTIATARIDANGAIDAANVRLYGARESDVTDALLNTGSAAVLTATAVNGKVVLAAGSAAAGTDLSFAGAAAADIDGVASITHAGTVRAPGAGGDVLLATNGAIGGGGGGGGDLLATLGGVSLIAPVDRTITVGDIAATDAFTLATQANITTGAITVTGGFIDLATTVAGAIQTGALAAFDRVRVDAFASANVASAAAGVANAAAPLPPTTVDVAISAVDDIDIGSAIGPRDILLTSSAGNIDVTGNLTTGRTVTIDAALTATVGRGVDAGTNYTVDGAAVVLGTADATPGTQRAGGFIEITADTTSISGLGALTVRANRDGLTGARYLQLSAATAIDFADSTLLAGGPANQSVLALLAGTTIRLGSVAARRIVPVADFSLPFSTPGDFAATDVTVADDLSITSDTGSIRIGQATSQTGDIALTASAGDVTGLAGAAIAGPLDPGFGRANLTASAANKVIGVTASGNAQLGTLTAGISATALNNYQIDVSGTAVSLVRGVAINGDMRATASGGDVALGSADVRRNLTVDATGAAAVTGGVVAGGFYTARGTSVTLGDGTAATQAARGSVDITATAGPVTGNAGLTLQSNSGGVADAANTRFLRLTATGDAIDFAATSQLLGGTAGQSVLALNGTSAIPANDATAIDLGIVRARTIAPGDLAATGFVTATDLTAVDIVTRDTLDLTSTAGSLRLGTVTSQTGNVVLTTTNATALAGDITGLATGGGFGRAALTASAANATIAVRAINAPHLVQLGIVSAGTGTGSVALDQIALEGGVLDVTQATARNGGLLAQSTSGDVILAGGSSARGRATIEAQANARLGTLTSITGLVDVRTTTGDVTGLASGGGFGRGDLTASAADQSVSVTAAGAVVLGTLSAGQDVTVRAGSAITPSDGAIDLTSVIATNGDYTLDAFSADLTAAVRNGDVTLGTGNAGRDATIRTSGDIRLTNATVARDLTLVAGTAGVSTDSAAIVTGTVVAGSVNPTGTYTVSGSRVELGGTQSAAGLVDIFAYGVDVADGITGTSGVTLTSNRTNAATANPLLLRADGGAGIVFAANSTLLGGANGISADIGISDPLATLALGNVRARSVQGLNAVTPGFGSLTTPNPVTVTGNVDLNNSVVVRGALAIVSQTGDITTRAITVGTAADGDRSLTLTASNGAITANAALTAFGDVTLDALFDIRFASITTSPVPSATPTFGDIAITSVQGDVTGLADTLGALAPFGIGALDATGGDVTLNLPGNAAIGTIDAQGLIDLDGSDIRLDRATSRTGGIDITASGALTGTPGGFAGVGTVSADLDARGAIRVTAGGAGTPRAVNLRDVTAGTDITVEADRIALASATATSGALTLIAGSTLALGSGTAGTLIDISGTGVTGAPALVSDFAAGVLDTNFGSTDLIADTDGETIRVSAGTIAQLGTVRAGTLASSGAFGQIDLSAGALTAASLSARNGDILVTTGPGIAPTIGSPLYVASIVTTNGVELRKTGDNGLSHDELRVGSITAALGDIALFSDTSARLGSVTATVGSVAATASADLTGLILPAPAGTAPDPAFALLGLTAGRDIALDAGDDLQTGTLTAGRDIDATAGDIAWLGGTTTATAGHYRVTGGTVLLGTPGNVVQTAATDIAIRSTAGDITGGSGLLLTSDSGNTGATGNYLVLDSAAGIAFANGLNGDTIATVRGGTNGVSADIGIRLAPNATLQLGNVAARTIGSASGPSGVPALYTLSPVLTTRGAISARDITVARDLAIDNLAANADITLDTARAIGGGINIFTTRDLKGREIDPVAAPGVFARTDLTAALGIETFSGFGLFGAVDAGTGVRLATGSSRLDATSITARAGDLVLDSASHIRVDIVTASGDGLGLVSAQMLASPILPSATLTTAGDITAFAARDVTDTALGGSAIVFSGTGGVTIVSTATAAGDGVIRADVVSANGVAAGHRDAVIAGRHIAIGTRVESNGGDALLVATEAGAAQSDVSVTAPLVTAAFDVTIEAGLGTALAPAADNGSLRVGRVAANTGSILLTALDGDITGRGGSTDGLDPLHDRIELTAFDTITARSGGLTSIGLATATAVRIEAGDVNLAGSRADNGAIDITRAATTGDLTLTARAATATGGFGGDIRVGATAAGQPAPGIAATTSGTALLETQGVRGDVTVASALVTTGDLTIRSTANARLAGGDAPPFTTRFLESTGGNIAITTGTDVTGLRIPGTTDDTLASFGRTDLRTGGAGTITLTAGGALQLGTLTAGTDGQPDIADQIVATSQAIDITTATANNGNLSLTSTLGDIRLDAGDALIDARIDAAANARLGTLLTRTGNIAVTAGTDVTGLPDASGFGRAILTTNGAGTITFTAGGALQLGTVIAGTIGLPDIADQIVATAQAIDITTATANNGNLSLTSTLGDVRLDAGDALIDARIDAAANARLGTLLTRTGNIAVTAGTDVTGLPDASGFGRAILTTNGTGTITLTAGGALQLGTVTAGTVGQPDIADQIVATAEAIDITTATANNGNLSLTSTLGDIRLDAGDALIDARIDAAANARLGTLLTRTGNIAVTARGGDVTGLPEASGFARADLATQGTGTITVDAANGTAFLGPVVAGTPGTTTPTDQIVVTAQAIDLSTITARNGNLSLTSTLGDVRVETGVAQTNATIVAASNARIGTLTTQTGDIAVTAGADVTGLSNGTGFARADLTANAIGTIALTANSGTLLLGTVTAGTIGQPDIADQITATAQAIDLTTAIANNGNLSLTSIVGDVRIETGTSRGDTTLATAGNARIGTLTTQSGNIAITTGTDVSGLRIAGLDSDLANFDRADLTTGGVGTITLTAGGALQLDAVTAGTLGGADIGDQIVATAQAVDITTATASNGSLSLTSTLDDVRLDTGDARVDATIDAAANARLGAVLARTGDIRVTARAGDVTGLPDATGFARADLATEGAGGIAVSAANGTALLGPVIAGTPGTSAASDQIVVAARAIDITTAVANGGNLSLTTTLGDVRIESGTAQRDATIVSGGNTRIGTLVTQTGNIAVTAGADVSGLVDASGVTRADLTAGGVGTITLIADTGALRLGSVVAGTVGQPDIADQIVTRAQAIDIVTGTANNGTLALTSTRDDVRIESGTAQVGAAIAAAGSARIGALVTATGAIAIDAGADVTGLALPGATGTDPASFERADLTAGGVGSIALTAGGTLRLGPVVAGTAGEPAIGDQIVATGGAIDITTVTARNGNLVLATTLGDVRIETGAAQVDATIAAAGNAQIGTLATQIGNIAVTAGADVTGLADAAGFARADLAAGGTGAITVAAANGTAFLGPITAGIAGTDISSDQIAVTAQAIDITTATTNNGNLSLTSTLGDVRIETGVAQRDATIVSAGNTRIETLAAQTGNIAITSGADVTGLADASGIARADLTTGTFGTITLTANTGALRLGSVTAGTAGQPDIADQIVATAQAIDITTATANNGNLSLTSTLGDVRLDAGDALIDARIDADANARLGTLLTRTGNIAVTAGTDVTGLPDASGFGRAILTTNGTGTITLTAGGALQLGTVTAGTVGQPDIADQIIATAQAIDITTATANNGNLSLTSTLGDIRLDAGDALIDARIDADANARLGTLLTRTGNIAVTAGTDVTGLPDASGFGRAILITGGTITLTAGGALQLGTVTAGTVGEPDIADQIIATAQAIDITTATTNNGNLSLTSTLGDIRLDAGDALVDARIDAAANARLGTLLTRAGNIAVTARGGDVTGLPEASGFARADLATQGTGTITVDAANGTAFLGPVVAGTPGTTTPTDQIVVTAQAIDLATITARNGNVSLTSTLGDVRVESGVAQTNATIVAASNARIGTLTTQTGDIAVTAGADVTGLSNGTGFARADLTANAIGTIALTANSGTLLLGTVTAGTIGQPDIADQITATAQAIDLTTAIANNGNLSLTSIVGDVRIETGTSRGDTTLTTAGNARIGTLTTQSGNIAITTGADVSGLRIAGLDSDLANFDRADLTTGGVGTITLTAGGALQLDAVTAGTLGGADIGDQIVATAQAVDITTATASNGSLSLTSTLDDVRLDTGDARVDATIDAAANARLGTVLARTGDIRVTARTGDVTGLPDDAGFGRADLATASGGAIAISAANGTTRLGTISIGDAGGGAPSDQFVVTASAVDVDAVTASSGNLSLTATAGDVRLVNGAALGNATIAATGNARIGTLTTQIGSIAVTAGSDVTGLPDASGFGRADLAAGGAGTITLAANTGALRLGTVTAGTTGLPDIGDQVVATARTIDITTAAANNGNLVLTSTLGDLRLDTGSARIGATIDAAASARIGTLATAAGNIRVTARGADVSGLPDATGFGRADLATGGVGTISVAAANGTARLGSVAAGTVGTTTPTDQLVVTAQAIDVETGTARNGNLALTATVGDVRLATGAAQVGTTIVAAGNARIGTLATQAGNVSVTAGADATGLAFTTGAGLAGFGRADLTAGGSGAIALTTATGAQQLGTLTAADRIVATARAIDITAATANNGNLSLTATADDVRLGTGVARADAIVVANRSAAIDTLTTQNGRLALTATTGDVRLGTGVARTDATLLAATNAAVGSLTAQTGAITVTATRGNIAGTAATGANFATLAAGKTIALTADLGSATLSTVDTVDGAITLTAADATLNGVVNADSATIDILRGSGSTTTRIGTLAAATGALALDDTEMGRLQADTVRIGSRIAASGTAADIAIGGLTIGTATGDKALKFLSSGRIALSGAIKDAGAVARTLQIGGDDAALGTTTPVATPLASRIDATLVPGGTGAALDLVAATIDLRAARLAFGNDSFLGEVATATGALSDPAAAQLVADDLVANAGSSLYRRNLSRDVFLRAKLLRVSYSGFALFQNTDPSLLGLGVELGLGGRSVASPAVLELRSLGESPANSFALFGTINGFVGRTAGVLPNAVLEFVDGSRTVRITQSNSRINGCVIGSPDRGCLITDAPPPLIRIFDQRQLQLFGVADDLTIPFEPSVGSSNEALIGDFTTTGGLIDPDCTVPDATGCPTQGERP